MAKRRNQKKEKALRNQAYARKFRKRTNTGRFGRRRYGNNDQDGAEMNTEERGERGESGAEGAADTV